MKKAAWIVGFIGFVFIGVVWAQPQASPLWSVTTAPSGACSPGSFPGPATIVNSTGHLWVCPGGTLTWTDIVAAAGTGTVSGQTVTNGIPKATGTAALGAQSSIVDNGTTVAIAEPVIVGATPVTVSGCGTAAAIHGNGTVGSFTVGTGASNCTFTITLNGATGLTASTGWVANADDVTAAIHCLNAATVSTTTVVFTCTGSVATSDLIKFSASPY